MIVFWWWYDISILVGEFHLLGITLCVIEQFAMANVDDCATTATENCDILLC